MKFNFFKSKPTYHPYASGLSAADRRTSLKVMKRHLKNTTPKEIKRQMKRHRFNVWD